MRRRSAFSLVELLVVIAIILLMLALLFPAIQKVREAFSRMSCGNNLHQVGVALHLYHNDYGRFPPAFVASPPPPPPPPLAPIRKLDRWQLAGPSQPGWGWASLLLPYIEQDGLAAEIDFKIPVESPSHNAVRIRPIKTYTCPSDWQSGVFTIYTEFDNSPLIEANTNSYAACYGWQGLIATEPEKGTGVFFRNSLVRIADIIDGTSNTFTIGERGAVLAKAPWAGVATGGSVRTTPGAPVFRSVVQPAPVMVMARVGTKYLNDPGCEPYDFFSPHPKVVQFVFADGSVHGLNTSTDVFVLGRLATRAGLEHVEIDD